MTFKYQFTLHCKKICAYRRNHFAKESQWIGNVQVTTKRFASPAIMSIKSEKLLLLLYIGPLRMRFRDRPNKYSTLCIAAKAGHVDVVRLLLGQCASVKERGGFGYSVHSFAICCRLWTP
ncbi:hypothetical protein EYC84_010347 [Monilinia fructicola]|uniref:Uncharacterized protein n=1 Tax=Monilinia fructicola TaxID=38448 RepID=A0A5M9JHW1_MONFR|nr:hypothetical protein EYC84_010347 [Monilinia fructicola]